MAFLCSLLSPRVFLYTLPGIDLTQLFSVKTEILGEEEARGLHKCRYVAAPRGSAPKNHVDCSREKREKVEEEKREEKLVCFFAIKSSVGDFNNKIPYSCRHTNRTQEE